MRPALLIGVGLISACSATKQVSPALEPAPPELVAAMRGHVEALAGDIGGRGLERPASMRAAAAYVREVWTGQGYAVEITSYEVDGQQVDNLAVEIPGQSPELVIIGAHYDTCEQNPGADDNASGVAALLELSDRLRGLAPDRTILFVAFANEEPPYFKDPASMGSSVYAERLRAEGREVAAMLSLESIGYFREEPGSQHYPAIIAPLYPDTGDFIAVVGKNRSRPLVRAVVDGLERHGPVGVESIAAPATITGIDWSDHWSFWQQGWPAAVMITDTAVYRNPNYHRPTDTPDTLDYERLAWVVVALDGTIRELSALP
jgi:Zn-dependent M28 family amino/carboxypeptidase